MKRLYKELESYGNGDVYPFHMPGHKRNLSSVNGNFPLKQDITEIEGFDNLHHAQGILKEAQEAVSRLYGTKESFYSINGSTAALLAAVSASVKKGGRILVARNCHKAVYHALYLRELKPVYIYPSMDSSLGLNGSISCTKVQRILEEHHDIQAVLITSPTYDGVVSDVKSLAEIAHRYGIPLIVDEAHGAHLRFFGYFPVPAEMLGADLVIQSLHKTLPSMTQTAVVHRCTDLVDREALVRFMGIYQSSSPSYVLMASMDSCIHKLETEGKVMFKAFTELLDRTRERLEKCRNIRLFTPAMAAEAGIYEYDRSKLLFFTDGTSLTGRELYEILLNKYHLQMEMEAGNYVLAMATVGDTEEGMERLCEAIEEIDRQQENLCERDTAGGGQQAYCINKQVLAISEAMDAPCESCPLEESIGRISAEFAYLYPPGIPIIAPGEQITGQFVRNVRRYMEQGLELQGFCDYTNETIRVLVPAEPSWQSGDVEE